MKSEMYNLYIDNIYIYILYTLYNNFVIARTASLQFLTKVTISTCMGIGQSGAASQMQNHVLKSTHQLLLGRRSSLATDLHEETSAPHRHTPSFSRLATSSENPSKSTRQWQQLRPWCQSERAKRTRKSPQTNSAELQRGLPGRCVVVVVYILLMEEIRLTTWNV